MRLRNVWVVMVVLAVFVAGCSSHLYPDVSKLPDGAFSLIMNQPDRSSVEGLTVVAGNIDYSGAHLAGWNPADDKPGTGGWVAVGDTIDIEGTTLRLVAVWEDPDPGEGDGGDCSKAWVVVEK
jgi:hypothetical protein